VKTVGGPLIAERGLTAYIRFCRDRGYSLTDTYINCFGQTPRKPDQPPQEPPHRRAGELTTMEMTT
jgi:hypothetical protein